MSRSWRFRVALAAALVWVLAGAGPAGSAHATPPAPDLNGLTAVAADPFVSVDAVGNATARFRTASGLQCGIRNLQAGCDGSIPTRATEVNEIVIGNNAGLWATARPRFSAGGTPVPTLHDGQKLAFAGIECGAGPGPVLACTTDRPDAQWLVVSPSGSGIGPPPAGLPPGFPDPDEFVRGDDDYLVGQGPKNIFPIFTVGNGLTCSIVIFSGGEVGCDGPLPGAANGANQVSFPVPGGPAMLSRTDAPRFATPSYAGTVRRLPVGHRVGDQCLALTGGVACLDTTGGRFTTGFVVTADGVTIY